MTAGITPVLPIAWAFLAMIRAALVEPAPNEALAHGIAEIFHHSVVARAAPNTP